LNVHTYIEDCNSEAGNDEQPRLEQESEIEEGVARAVVLFNVGPAANATLDNHTNTAYCLPTSTGLAVNMVHLSLSPYARHLAMLIRAKFSHGCSKLDGGAIDLKRLNRLDFIQTDPYIAEVVERILSDDTGTRKIPFDILQGLVRGAVYNDRRCQDSLLRVHADCMSRRDVYSPKELRIIRKGYLMLDLYCLVGTKFTRWEVVEAVRQQFFFKPMDGNRLPDVVFRSFIHHAVRNGILPKMTAVHILLLHSADDTDVESEVEKAVFDDKELFGPQGFIHTNDGRVVDRAMDISLYDGMVHAEDLENSPASKQEIENRLQSYTEDLQRFVSGDQRPGAFDSVTVVSSSPSS
jgi:hypothetical protein